MAYSKIRQPKLSDVIEQQLEFLILEGTLRPGEKLPPERELAKQFDVSRPSLREAIQRLEAKGLLLRRQGGGTFVQSSLWQSFSDPLVELLSDHPESQYDLLETRHALEGIAAYYAALRSTDEDKERIRELHHAIELAQQSGDLDAESNAVLQYQIAVTEAAHNVVLLHLLRCMEPMLAQNVRQNFELLYSRREMLPLVSSHRTRIFEAIMAGKPEEAREASHRHLAFIEEICSTEVVKRAAVSVLCVVWSNERISDFSGKNYPEDVVNQAHIKARQLNVEPVLLSFPARVQWDRFQKTQRY